MQPTRTRRPRSLSLQLPSRLESMSTLYSRTGVRTRGRAPGLVFHTNITLLALGWKTRLYTTISIDNARPICCRRCFPSRALCSIVRRDTTAYICRVSFYLLIGTMFLLFSTTTPHICLSVGWLFVAAQLSRWWNGEGSGSALACTVLVCESLSAAWAKHSAIFREAHYARCLIAQLQQTWSSCDVAGLHWCANTTVSPLGSLHLQVDLIVPSQDFIFL